MERAASTDTLLAQEREREGVATRLSDAEWLAERPSSPMVDLSASAAATEAALAR
jgi:hypothetical protein